MSPADAAAATLMFAALAVYGGALALVWLFITTANADSYADQRKRDRAFWNALRRQPQIR